MTGMGPSIEPPQGDTPSAPASAGQRVLVVDDDKDFAASLTNLLRIEGYRVHVAHDVESALAGLIQSGALVALVDIRLGSESGVDLVQELRRHRPEMICVIVTAFASLETAIQALQAGAYDYLCKPFYSHDLLATLARCFERLELIERHRRASELLSHRKRMEAIGQMTRGIAHDFNNMLSVQYATLRWLEDHLPTGSEMADAVADALGSLESGRTMAKRLLDFGRMGAGETEMVDLQGELPQIARLLRRTLGEDVAVTVEVANEALPVQTSRGGLEAALLNLALNARDAMTKSAWLALDARKVAILPEPGSVDDAIPGAYIRLSVADSGTGMSAEIRRRALQPLFTTKPRGQGSGLGLPMVDNFIRQAGGYMAIASAPGEGTRVDLYFPCVTSSEASDTSTRGTNV
ncbi:response regulator [Limibaculum sp. M0105]|uniref:histidine kinase n=1 Tax=Thermohalobaculum xanthum TaxID=2753746 RepID=A0A8J7SB30_9RHOB|nr:response regulator [Thermohalobaculum xanthum]MBK0398218.1 response regulator [Thermohalobaculum xanthum]